MDRVDKMYCAATGVDRLPDGDFVLPVVNGINKGMWLYHVDLGATGWTKTEDEGRAEIERAYLFREKFWNEKVLWMEAGDLTPTGSLVLRVEGAHYTVPRVSSGPAAFKGHAGRVFRWRIFGDDMIRESDNVWYQGDIPDSHREALPDNAEWVSPKAQN